MEKGLAYSKVGQGRGLLAGAFIQVLLTCFIM